MMLYIIFFHSLQFNYRFNDALTGSNLGKSSFQFFLKLLSCHTPDPLKTSHYAYLSG